jgi:iron complex transport system permease protein
MARASRPVLWVGLLAAAAASAALSIRVGPVPWSELSSSILLEYRVPRTLLAFLAGGALAVAGTCFQGLFRNVLADPFVVGVSGGSALGAVLSIVAGAGLAAATGSAFAGGLGAAYLAYVLAWQGGRSSVEGLVLTGSAIGSFAGAMVSILIYLDSRNWVEVVGWLMGNVGRADPWPRVKVLAPSLLAGAGWAWLQARELNLLLFGEETAGQLGVEAERAKRRLLAAGALCAASAVATCGMIGFVGLIVPHALRRWAGPDHRGLVPASLVGGGALLMAADAVSRALSPHSPLPVGAVTALAGAPFFLYLFRYRR